MKKIILFSILISVFACTQDEERKHELRLINITGAEKVMVATPDSTYEFSEVTDSVILIPLNIEEPTQINYMVDRARGNIFVLPGEDIVMDPDFKGDGLNTTFASEGNSVLISKLKKDLNKAIAAMQPTLMGVFQEEPDSALISFDAYAAGIDSIFLKHPDVKKEYADALKTMSKLIFVNFKSQYPEYYKYINKLPDTTMIAPIINTQEALSRLDLNNIALAYFPSAADQLMNIVIGKLPEEDYFSISAFKSELSKIPMNENLHNEVYEKFFLQTSEVSGLKIEDKDYEAFLSKDYDKSTKKAVKKSYEAWKKIRPGNASPPFSYRNIKGEAITLESLKGKNLYIDVWATWCGPCIREVPHLKTLEEKYANSESLEFVSISVDQDSSAWARMVTDKNMSGIQIISPTNWDSPFISSYNIKGIPRFILIDADGNIIDADAPRPSSEEINGILAELAK